MLDVGRKPAGRGGAAPEGDGAHPQDRGKESVVRHVVGHHRRAHIAGRSGDRRRDVGRIVADLGERARLGVEGISATVWAWALFSVIMVGVTAESAAASA